MAIHLGYRIVSLSGSHFDLYYLHPTDPTVLLTIIKRFSRRRIFVSKPTDITTVSKEKMDQPKGKVYVELTTTNERLIAEMNQFLVSIGDTTTKTTDSSSTSKNNDSKSEKKPSTLSTPSSPISVTTSEKCDAATTQTPRPSSNSSSNANANGAVQGMESDANSVFDDDSLLAMAKRMDDSASIMSDITTSSFRTKTLAAISTQPSTKNITASMKKLGQKINITKKLSIPTTSRKTAPPPRKSQPSRNNPQKQQQQQLNNHQLMIAQDVVGCLPSGADANVTTTTVASSKFKCDHSTTTSTSPSSPSSSKDTIDIRLASNSKQYGEVNNKATSDTANSSAEEVHNKGEGYGWLWATHNTGKKSSQLENKDEVAGPDEQQLSPGMRAIHNAYIQQWGENSLPPQDEGKPPARHRSSKKKNKHRSPPTTNDAATTLPANNQGGSHNDSEITLDKMPGASAYLGRGNAITTTTTKKSKKSPKSRRRRKKMGHNNKKRQQKKKVNKDDDSDEEPMTGIGFNTRVHTTPITVVQEEAQDDNNSSINNISDYNNEELLMKWVGDTTSPKIETNSKGSADQIMREAIEKSRMRLLTKPLPIRTDIQEQHNESSENDDNDYTDSESVDNDYTNSNSENTDDHTCSNSENDNDSDDDDDDNCSAYDSDDQTQIFYESDNDYCRDDDYDSEEEEQQRVAAVGTSVADAVKGLNNNRAVTKVKNLFGIRK